ncbi:hypothetical protein DL96DRAFT_1586614 [Flagelloscypha sp. PMI_526]|nr:hypothetical protein DL96DRAFT_1586614 [Flagelloscypha sp. PMI_526]
MFSTKASLIALAFAATAASSHIDVSRRHNQVHVNRSEEGVAARSIGKRMSGKFSYYSPEPVACGGSATYDGHTCAISVDRWDGGSHCGEKVTIKVGGVTRVATITDECMGCPPDQLDLTPGLFKELSGGSLDAGILHGEWDFGDAEEQAKKAAEEKAQQEQAAKEKAAKAKADAEKKSKAAASSSSKAAASSASVASVASVSKASVASVASASSASAASASAAAAASAQSDSQPTEAPQAVGGAVSGPSFNSAVRTPAHAVPIVLFGALLGAALMVL